MSLLDFIFEQKIVLVAVLFAIVPLVAALVLFVVVRVRRTMRKRAAMAQEQPSIQADTGIIAQAGQEDVRQVQEDRLRGRPAQPTQSTQSTPPTQASNPGDDTSGEVNPDEAEFQEEEEQEDEDAVSSAMQDLLSSVFNDDEAEARYAVLLKGLDAVDITHLAALTSQIARQLNAGNEIT
jgi:preprotein translocase subunit YajC